MAFFSSTEMEISMSNTITCPKCQNEIEISEVMKAQLGDSIRKEVVAEYEDKLTTERAKAMDKAKPSDRDRPEKKVGFRNIPTWEEVVGLVVAKNIESRSKRSQGNAPKGRGRRGARSNQGGKRRS